MINVVMLIMVCLFAGLPCRAQATLIGVSENLVYDDLTSQYWYSDISEFSGGTGVNKALQWIPTNYFGLDTWHLASRTEATTLLSGTTPAEFMNYFPPTGSIYTGEHSWDLGTGPTGNYKYWVGGTDSYIFLPHPNTINPLALLLFTVRINYASNDMEQLNPLSIEYPLGGDGPQWLRLREVGTWVTASGPAPGSGEIAPVPEPSTMMLLTAVMVGLACISLVKKRGKLL